MLIKLELTAKVIKKRFVQNYTKRFLFIIIVSNLMVAAP
ncbi:hypothetical protein M2138_001957 [Dysgonomonadaceae bacterium PH5-43]|nr:hypothetical protein [Dysgonomonadaceae bacterium PH5-43]